MEQFFIKSGSSFVYKIIENIPINTSDNLQNFIKNIMHQIMLLLLFVVM
mgnify:CR=1 FL=1